MYGCAILTLVICTIIIPKEEVMNINCRLIYATTGGFRDTIPGVSTLICAVVEQNYFERNLFYYNQSEGQSHTIDVLMTS